MPKIGLECSSKSGVESMSIILSMVAVLKARDIGDKALCVAWDLR